MSQWTRRYAYFYVILPHLARRRDRAMRAQPILSLNITVPVSHGHNDVDWSTEIIVGYED